VAAGSSDEEARDADVHQLAEITRTPTGGIDDGNDADATVLDDTIYSHRVLFRLKAAGRRDECGT
jgi:hypothetical protein